MSLNRFAKKRDANEGPIVEAAARMGWYLVKLDTPCDWFGCLIALERWCPIEIKVLGASFRESQVLFRSDCSIWRMPYLVWTSIDDVIATTNRLRAGGSGVQPAQALTPTPA